MNEVSIDWLLDRRREWVGSWGEGFILYDVGNEDTNRVTQIAHAMEGAEEGETFSSFFYVSLVQVKAFNNGG